MSAKMPEPINISIAKGAIFSDDRRYRYALWRVWSPNKPLLLQIGLNPSVANEIRDDPTITRGITRAGQNGFGGFLMGNLFGFVSTNPDALLKNANAVGEFTDHYLREMVKLCTCQLCGWGSFKPVKLRAATVYAMLPNPMCLGYNADGQPKHPLYVGYDTKMMKCSIPMVAA